VECPIAAIHDSRFPENTSFPEQFISFLGHISVHTGNKLRNSNVHNICMGSNTDVEMFSAPHPLGAFASSLTKLEAMFLVTRLFQNKVRNSATLTPLFMTIVVVFPRYVFHGVLPE
jgi:hypothetical protein